MGSSPTFTARKRRLKAPEDTCEQKADLGLLLVYMSGYHIKKIKRGELGKPSKIREELEEFMDACEQDCSLMALIELSDMVGAIKLYLELYHPSITMKDLEKMATVTRRAFETGHR